MDALVKLVSQKVGISEDQARMAVTTVLGFLKEKLPAPIASQIDAVISGGGQAQESLDIRGKTGPIQLDPRLSAFLRQLPEEAQEAAIPAGEGGRIEEDLVRLHAGLDLHPDVLMGRECAL